MRDSIFIPEHRTKVLPLRWLADYVFHPLSMVFFHIGLRANDQIYESGEGYTIWDEIKEKIGYKVYNFLNHPYEWWGTIYKLDLKGLDLELSGDDWDDYDDQGHPYWDYWWHVDETTGDGWRLINKDQLTHDEMQNIFGVYSEEDIDRID